MRTITRKQHSDLFQARHNDMPTFYLQYEKNDPDKREFIDDYQHTDCIQVQALKAKDWKAARELIRAEHAAMDWLR